MVVFIDRVRAGSRTAMIETLSAATAAYPEVPREDLSLAFCMHFVSICVERPFATVVEAYALESGGDKETTLSKLRDFLTAMQDGANDGLAEMGSAVRFTITLRTSPGGFVAPVTQYNRNRGAS